MKTVKKGGMDTYTSKYKMQSRFGLPCHHSETAQLRWWLDDGSKRRPDSQNRSGSLKCLIGSRYDYPQNPVKSMASSAGV